MLTSSIIVYLTGLITGLLISVTVLLFIGRKALLSKAKPSNTNYPLKEKMAKVKELTDQQLTLQGQASSPQKNALDGKYKNGLMKEIEFLEEQKVDILKSIIKDGFDPEITTMDEYGQLQKIKLSAFLAERGIDVNEKVFEDPKTKFTVIPGGKSETTH